ncbi:MAG: arsenic transporter [Erysipelotrichaceae bacterium]|nr:arsenic transporter [Erysipelotrichaceae bacterium]
METITIFALGLFILTYVLLITFSDYRPFIAIGSAALFVVLKILPLSKVIPSIDFNVLMMIAGTMGLVALFIESKMPDLMAEFIIDKMPNIKWMTLSLALFAGIISAFIDNVATVLMVAPVAITLCKKLNVSPVKSIIAIAISSNLQGAATLVGDTTSILLGGYNNMNFLDFFFYNGKIGLFWIVQIAMLGSLGILYFIFRNDNQPISYQGHTKVTNYVPTVLLLGLVLLLISASFIPNGILPEVVKININGIICIILMIVGIVHETIIKKDINILKNTLKEIDLYTIGLLLGLFIVISGIKEAKVIDWLASLISNFGGGNVFILYSVIVWVSVILSAFIDNIPYVLTMLPVVTGIASSLGIDQTILMFGLLSGATLGGNLTPIGASANITALGLLRKEGYQVKNIEFMKISIPFTLVAVLIGYLLIWIIYA